MQQIAGDWRRFCSITAHEDSDITELLLNSSLALDGDYRFVLLCKHKIVESDFTLYGIPTIAFTNLINMYPKKEIILQRLRDTRTVLFPPLDQQH